MSLKHACCCWDAEGGGGAYKFFVQRFAKFGRRCLDEARAAAAACVTIERELRDSQQRAAHIEQRAVHFSYIVIENAQIHDFLGHRSGRGGVVVAAYGEQNYKAGANFTGRLAVDHNPSFGHTLQNGAQIALLA
ncbi:MAG TPA: hypothetical protein VGR81_12095 [Candidatus Acidoferrales bacterium]|nr:hypothetical protein [Candidatus Acidoferrales bacterium]